MCCDLWPLTGKLFPVVCGDGNEHDKDILAAGPLSRSAEGVHRLVLKKDGDSKVMVAKQAFPNWPETTGTEFHDVESLPLSAMQKALILFSERIGDDSYRFRTAA